MGAFTDFDDYQSRVAAPQRVNVIKEMARPLHGYPASLWTTGVVAGAAPSTASVCTSATTGALGQVDGSSGALRLSTVDLHLGPDMKDAYFMAAGVFLGEGGVLLLVDRLSHQGGLSGSTTAEQTTNLPTAALTRHTDGTGVWASVEIYTELGATASTITASYTDQAGNAGHTTVSTPISAGVGFRYVGNSLFLPLQAGDSGVRSVESVTLSVSTGSLGNWGVTLVKPLAWIPVTPVEGAQRFDPVRGTLGGGMPEIVDGACLAWYYIPTFGGALSGVSRVSGAVEFCET